MELSTHPAESHHPSAPSGGAACGLEEEYSFVTLQVKHADSCSVSPSLAITKTRLGEDWPDPCWEAVGEGPPYPLHRVKTGTVSTKMNMDLLADPALLLFFARNLICVCACRYVRVWFYLHIRTCVCVCVCVHMYINGNLSYHLSGAVHLLFLRQGLSVLPEAHWFPPFS